MAFLSTHSSPLGRAGARDTGGMSTYLRGLSKALGEAGHRVDLFTRAPAESEAGVWETDPNVRLIALDDGLGPLAKNEIYPHCPSIAASIDRFCRGERTTYHFIFSHYWLSGCIGDILQQTWKLPHLIMFHTLGRAKNEACCSENEPSLRIAEEERLARAGDRIVTAAKSEKEKIISFYGLPPEKVSVIPCGVDRTLFRPLESAETRAKNKEQSGIERSSEKIILSVGRIEPVKGFDLLINAAGLLPAEENFKVLIIGGDEESRAPVARLKETAVRLGIPGKVEFTGVVDHHKMPFYYNEAAITVLPSHYESFGLVALESIACGTPVVAGPVGIIPELFAAPGCSRLVCLVPDRSPETWAAGINQMLIRSDPVESAEIDSCLAPFSWPEVAGRLVSHMLNL